MLSALALCGGVVSGTAKVSIDGHTLNPGIKRLWDYNAKEDVDIDNLDVLKDEKRLLSGGASDLGYSYIDVDSSLAVNADNPIYKYSSEVQKGNLILKLEVNFDESVDLSKIFMKVWSNNDSLGDSPLVKLNKTINVDEDENSSIQKGEWTTLTISFSQTFAEMKYQNGDVDVASNLCGLFLISEEGNAGHIKIRKISLLSGENETIIDDFHRDNGNPANCWWSGTQGTFVKRYITVKDGGSYTYKAGALIDKKNLVLNAKGDLSGMSLALVKADGTIGDYIAASLLKDQNNEAISTTYDEYKGVSINLANSGLEGEFAGFSVKSTTELMINKVYASDCSTRAPERLRHELDLDNAIFFNDFNVKYEEGKYPTNYDASTTETPEVLKEHGIERTVNWGETTGIKFDGSSLVLDKTDKLGNFFMATTSTITEKDYLVISLKVEESASLEKLRFTVGGSTVWLKDAKAEFGIATTSSINSKDPYYDATSGYQWFVINLEESGVDTSKLNSEFTIFYDHSVGKILIDEIFYADAAEADYNEPVPTGAEGNVGEAGYFYGGYIPAGTRFYTFTLTAEKDGLTLEDYNLEQAGVGSKYVVNKELILEDGSSLEAKTFKKDETLKVTIDLLKSGFDTSISSHYHMHFKAGQTFKVSALATISVYNPWIELLAEDKTVTFSSGYTYGFGLDLPHYEADRLGVTIEADKDYANGLFSVRFEIGGKLVWIKDAKTPSGESVSLDLKKGSNYIELDLVAAGFTSSDIYNADALHVHTGDVAVTEETTLKFTSIKFIRTGTYGELNMSGLEEPDYEAPKGEIKVEKENYYAGDSVKFSVTASDNKTETKDLNIETKVVLGSGTSLEEIEVKDNTFIAKKAGTYTITVVISDKAGNQVTLTKQVVVKELTAPTGSISVDKASYVAGDTVKVSITASDELTPSDKLVVVTKVMFGDKEVALTNGEFVASEAGTYVITSTITNEAGLSTTLTKSIEVTKKKKGGCGGSILATSGIIALLSGLGVSVLLVKKKKEDK